MWVHKHYFVKLENGAAVQLWEKWNWWDNWNFHIFCSWPRQPIPGPWRSESITGGVGGSVATKTCCEKQSHPFIPPSLYSLSSSFRAEGILKSYNHYSLFKASVASTPASNTGTNTSSNAGTGPDWTNIPYLHHILPVSWNLSVSVSYYIKE